MLNDVTSIMAVAKDYADLLVKPALEQIGGAIADHIAAARVRNQVKIVLKTKQFLEDRGVDPTRFLPDAFAPVLDAGGNASDESLVDMFASLLANQMDPSSRGKAHPAFAKVLSELSPLDAAVMRCMSERQRLRLSEAHKPTNERQELPTLNAEVISNTIPSSSEQDVALSLANLKRLGLCVGDEAPLEDDIKRDWKLVSFGHKFLAACTEGEYWYDRPETREQINMEREGRTRTVVTWDQMKKPADWPEYH